MGNESITATNLANWIPDIWAKDVLAAVENSLVMGSLVDRGYEEYARNGGDNIVVPNLAEISANAVNFQADLTLYDTIQGVTNIAINKKYDIAISVSDLEQLQSNPKFFERVKTKLAYGLAKQVDTNIGYLFTNFSANVGTVNVALTEDVLIDSHERLNSANAPDADRAWVFDPTSITDLLKLDYFVKMDYVPGSVVTNGFVGRSIFGAPVYRTTNLRPYATTATHTAGYFQREAIALVLQMPPKFEIARLPLRHSDAIIGLVAYGVQNMRTSFGVCINTRG